jgi:acyl-homoserine lactone acylase PvdQ
MILKKISLFLLIALSAPATVVPQGTNSADQKRWEQQAQKVTITRDDWGIAHVYGKTDADAVFGMIYAQAEDDFNRIEFNYLNGLGRLAEVEGESEVWRDLRMRLFVNEADCKKEYEQSPAWLKSLMNAWADGLNFYLYKHPSVTPRLIKHFEPWMALTFTEGSVPVGGDIDKVNLNQLQAFYGNAPTNAAEVAEEEIDPLQEPTGSNGAAVAPANTTGHHALLLINPHTSFYFRSELQMASDEGLNAYGAATWGQFFIYQGFNEHAGWMHTSSAVDATDEYLETTSKKGDHYVYKYGDKELPVTESVITIRYKTDSGVAERKFTTFATQHGPVVRSLNGKWVTFRLMQEPVKALMQSFTRTKSKNYKEYRQAMELHANSSNNTLFADSEGNIAYFHANYIPRRDPKFDWTKPVDGSDPATDWHGLLSVDESPNLLNPASGWVYNSNNSPWSAAGPSSLKKSDYPVYVDSGSESARGLHAIRVLQNKKDFTLDGLIAAAYDSYLPWFEKPIPALVKSWDQLSESDPLKTKVANQIDALRGWDFRWGINSIPTSLAVYWAEDIQPKAAGAARSAGLSADEYIATKMPAQQLLQSLAAASDKLTADFGKWQTPWGDINRFQRLTDDIVHPFRDDGPSIPVGFTSGNWGSLASFGARSYKGSKKNYGTTGNSFVAVVEFGPTLHARAVTAGGESGDPASKHFNDEAKRYSTGDLREVYFYKNQLKGHTEREYHPGS